MKRLLLIALLITQASLAADIVCIEGTCKDVDIVEERGNSLIKFTDEQKKAVAPAVIHPGDEVSHVQQNHFQDLKFSDFKRGACFIDPINRVFYKVLDQVSDNQKIRIVAEAEVHEYSLKVNTFNYMYPDAKAFKKLKKWSCERTANLGDNSYIEKCVGKSSFGDKLCDTPRMFK